MRLGFLMAAGIGALALGAPVSGQSSIRATAVVEAPVEARPVEVRLQRVGSRLSVREEMSAGDVGSRLLHRTFVGTMETEKVHLAPVRVRENGVMRLERRFVPLGGEPVVELRGSAGVLIDGTAGLTITRVIASNS